MALNSFFHPEHTEHVSKNIVLASADTPVNTAEILLL